jgi:murein L,D-transpeptidase YcbB/YkuD
MMIKKRLKLLALAKLLAATGSITTMIAMASALPVLAVDVPAHEAPSQPVAQLPAGAQFRLWLVHPDVDVLRHLLELAGYSAPPSGARDRYDLELMKDVRSFQTSHGMKSTGIPRERTIAALNFVAGASEPNEPPMKANPSKPAPAATPAPTRSAAAGSDFATALSTDRTRAGIGMAMLDSGTAERMTAALARYVALQSYPSLTPLPPSAKGQRNDLASVKPLVSRLSAEGFLKSEYASHANPEDTVRQALQEWQRHYGIPPTGSLTTSTWNAMNVPLADRIRQIKASLTRAKAMTSKLGRFYVLVNSAGAEVQVVEDDALSASFQAIVGRSSRKTPEFVTSIPYVQLLPTWTVPQSIARRDIAPEVRRNPGYLAAHHMRLFVGRRVVDPKSINWRRGPFPIVVQHPGPHNALGLIKFGMSSGGAHYIHGAAQPNLLRRRLGQRFLSSGCVRVADPIVLATIVLLHDEATWTQQKIKEGIARHDGGWAPGERIDLKRPVRAIWTYMTSWTTADGRTHFRNDVYGRNKDIDGDSRIASR